MVLIICDIRKGNEWQKFCIQHSNRWHERMNSFYHITAHYTLHNARTHMLVPECSYSYQSHDAYSIFFVHNECCWITRWALCITDRNVVARVMCHTKMKMTSNINGFGQSDLISTIRPVYTHTHRYMWFKCFWFESTAAAEIPFPWLQNGSQSTACE